MDVAMIGFASEACESLDDRLNGMQHYGVRVDGCDFMLLGSAAADTESHGTMWLLPWPGDGEPMGPPEARNLYQPGGDWIRPIAGVNRPKAALMVL